MLRHTCFTCFRSKPHLCPRNRMRTVSCPRILCVLWNSSGCPKQSIHQASKNRSCHAIANHEVDLPLCHAPFLLCIESLPNNPRRRNPLHPHHFCGAHHPAPVGNEKSPRTCAGTCQCGTEPHLPIVAEAFTLPHIEHIVSVLGSCPSAWVMRNKRSRLFKAVSAVGKAGGRWESKKSSTMGTGKGAGHTNFNFWRRTL